MSTLIQRSNGTIIYFDTAESVVKSFPSKVTTHPIEEGSPVTDHVVTEPKKVTVSGVISDASFMFAEDDPFTELRMIDGVSRRVPISGRSIAALSELESIRDNREKFQLETRDEVFSDMVFIAFEVPRDAQTGDAARVKFTAQQISTVQRRFATVPQAAVAAEDADKAAENAETGKQATGTADPSVFLQSIQYGVGQIKNIDDTAEIDSIINSGFNQ